MSDQRTLSMSGLAAMPDDDDSLSPLMLLRPYWRVTLAAFLGWFLDAFDQVALLLCLPDIGKSLGVGLTAMGLVITAQSVGRILGNTSWGWLSDRYGRKLTFMIGVLWFAAFSGFTALVWTYLGMLVVQFLFGIGFGGEWTASASLLMESVPPRARSLASSIMMAGYECGFFAAAAVQAVVLPYWGWRAMFLIGVIPAILAIFIRRDVAESPVWLRLRSMPPVPAAIRPRMGFSLDGAAIQALLFMAVLQFQNAAIYSFYPTLLRKVQNLTPAEVFPLLGCYCLGSLVGKPLCGLLATRMGERTVFVTYFLITIMDIWPFISATSMWVLAGAALVMGLFGNSVFALVPHYLSQRFPSANRSLGMGCSYAVAALGQGVCGFVVPWLGGQWGLPQAIESSVVIGTFMVAAVIFYQPPTLPGRHMEGEESIAP
ncbi:putative sialic acid transporter [Komagataeibacter europaeus]|uniref:Sialic acid transporter n=1 Tax=Komagataeibacter europaeus TaxID=33995 RepID=A0A0M0EGJ7_KOMEU|nr:MFS transporter [Komagataeibacter europaeus]KON64046.1 putative sialic acid transporter [Komagataeibacter europaeus]